MWRSMGTLSLLKSANASVIKNTHFFEKSVIKNLGGVVVELWWNLVACGGILVELCVSRWNLGGVVLESVEFQWRSVG